MKKILVINGSPKKEQSTTMAVTNAFVKGLLSSGKYESETLTVSSMNIKPCLGCLGCWGISEGECIIKDDDIPMLKSKILAADIIVLSFPLFYFGMPGSMKCAVDRLLSILNTYEGQDVPENKSFHGFRYDMTGKKLVLISGCAWNDFRVFSPLLQQFDCIVGPGKYTALFCPQIKAIVDQGMRPRLIRYLKSYEDAGLEFAENLALSPETSEKLKKTPFSKDVYTQILKMNWQQEREKGKKHS